MMNSKRIVPTLLLLATLAGCTSVLPETGRDEVAGLVAARGRDMPAGQPAGAGAELVAELAHGELTANDAIRLALLNNPQVQAEYARLGFAAADVYDAGRLSNPALSASIMFPDAGSDSNQYGFGLAQSFTDLLLLKSRSRLADAEYEQVKHEIGARLLELAADTEAAYTQYVSSQQRVTVGAAIALAATTAAELAQRFYQAGNLSRLDLAMQQAAAAEAKLELMQAKADLAGARAELNRLLGLTTTEDHWTASPQLPAPLPDETPLPELLTLADANRLDLWAARQRVTTLADALGVSRDFRLLGEFEAGLETERETDRSRITGPALTLELPLFNQGEGRVARARAELETAEADLRALEIAISNDVARGAAEVSATTMRAGHYRETLIPLRELVVDQIQRKVNFMLQDQFDLLQAKQQEYAAWQGYLEAVRDYWLARIALGRAVGTSLPGSGGAGDVIDARSLLPPTPAEDGAQHHHHSGHTMEADTPDDSSGSAHEGHQP